MPSITREQIEKILNQAIRSRYFHKRAVREVAFYGGTFTGLSVEVMKEVLEGVSPFMERGFFQGIRVSTRPDALDEARLGMMKDYGVDTVELGAQSMEDRVLILSKRGHTVATTTEAIKVLRSHGFRVGMQLMPGLPGDSKETFRLTINRVLALRPDMVRLYPALVLRNTALARWYGQGIYQPLSLEEAVEICAESCMRLEAEGIPVIRIGLMASPSLLKKGQIMAGPWHPAFGFLVRSRMHLRRLKPVLPRPGSSGGIEIKVPQGDIPSIRGYENQGIGWIKRETGAKVIKIVADDSLPRGEFRVRTI